MNFYENDQELNDISQYKIKKCLQCGTNTDNKDDNELFCSQCGAPVVNRCSDYHCNKLLTESARYCKYCGSSSIFKNYGLLDTPTSNDTDFPF